MHVGGGVDKLHGVDGVKTASIVQFHLSGSRAEQNVIVLCQIGRVGLLQNIKALQVGTKKGGRKSRKEVGEGKLVVNLKG